MPHKKVHQTKPLPHAAIQHPEREINKDETVVSIISALNVLIAQASGAEMGMAARILYNAKEELVHWAVDMNFHETCKDRFINQQLYESGLAALGEFMARVSALQDEALKSEIIKMLGNSLMKTPHIADNGHTQ